MDFWEWVVLLLIWIPLILLWAFALIDLFHTHLPGWAKGLWALVIVLLPLFGIVSYFIARPTGDDPYPDQHHSNPGNQTVADNVRYDQFAQRRVDGPHADQSTHFP